ncbi:MAG: 4-hydroxy-tetrahydrodipicolinate synthase [Isosphaeraceae bacterium]|nr:4-hydroxy-tetrahydrodipicolinate synthase [Isosphaeraceae bacterium]
MATKGRMFAGCTVALITPFRDGEVDYPALRDLVEWHVSQGTPTIAPVGTTGESPTLSHDEHDRVIATVVETAAGRVKVMAGTGSNATTEAVRLTKFAAKVVADGALLVAPYYNRPTQEGLYAHFATIAESCDIPQVLYNIPGRTGRNVEPETIERLAALDPIVAVKEAAGSLDQVSDLVARTNLTILSGDDSLTLPMLAVGGEGVVSVAANIVPRDVMSLIDAFQRGDLTSAQAVHRKLFPLCRDLLGLATNPIPVKIALKLLGRGNGELRLPLVPLDDRSVDLLRRSLQRYGLTPRDPGSDSPSS